MINQLPNLGVGIGFRDVYTEEILQDKLLNWYEITPENYLQMHGETFDNIVKASQSKPVTSHSVSFSVASTADFDLEYLQQLKEFFNIIKPVWFSDHLCMSSVNHMQFNDLIPSPRTEQSVQHIADRINFLQDYFQLPFLVENISYYYEYKGAQIPDIEFFNQITEKANCYMLFDVNNIYVNSVNHKYNAEQYIDQANLDRIAQIHIAGHAEYPDGLIDTHGEAICDGVWDLLEYLLQKVMPNALMIERDQNFPIYEEIHIDTQRLTDLVKKYSL